MRENYAFSFGRWRVGGQVFLAVALCSIRPVVSVDRRRFVVWFSDVKTNVEMSILNKVSIDSFYSLKMSNSWQRSEAR